MRIVIAADFPDDPTTLIGGIQSIVYYTLVGLVEYDELDVHVVSCEKWGKAAESGAYVRRQDGWTAHYLPSNPTVPHTITMMTADRRKVAAKIRELDPDVVHAHGQAAAYPWGAFDSGKPTVVTVQGINAMEAAIDPRGGRLRSQLRSAIWNRVESNCLGRATDLIVPSPFVVDFVKPYTSARLHAIENPVEPALFDIERNAINPGSILYVGSIQKRKGLTDLINALYAVRDEFPEAHIRVAGAFMAPYAQYGDEVKALISALEMTDRVHLLGHLNRAELLQEYATCSLFCLPSYLEASPVVVAEALASGCPILTTTIPSVDHLVKDGDTGFRFETGDISALTRKLRTMLSNDALRIQLGKNGREAAAERLTPATSARGTVALYQDMVASV